MMSLLLSRGAQADCCHSKSGSPFELELEECTELILRRKIGPRYAVQRIEIPRPTTIGANHENSIRNLYYYGRSSEGYKIVYGDQEEESFGDDQTEVSGAADVSSENDETSEDGETWGNVTSDDTEFSSIPNSQRILCCEEIMQILVAQGVGIGNSSSRPFGPPLHLASYLGSTVMVHFLIDSGSDVHKVGDDYFQSAIFAAIQGGHPDVVALLVGNDPSCIQQVHSEHGTPLHLACALDKGACARKLLELGADATTLNTQGQTPLTVFFKHCKMLKYFSTQAPKKNTALHALLSTAKYLRLSDDDLLAVLEIDFRVRKDIVASLLALDKEIVVTEHVICRAFKVMGTNEEVLDLFKHRVRDISVTTNMLRACQNDEAQQALRNKRLRDDGRRHPLRRPFREAPRLHRTSTEERS
ncbi:ankyrin 1 [Apiospora arundinis]|uniref:Ankyrin 1 n=1 Tax=Apiospora arundinis TaxID=335852 RepID=A0ABR2JH28_9PEZI